MTNTLLPRGSIGINVDLRADTSSLSDAAVLERLGYDALWIAGGQLDRLGRVRELLAATDRVRVATGIVPFGVHETADIAVLHDEMAARAPGRLVLGLGGPQQARPMAVLAEHLDDLDRRGVGADQRLLAALGPRKTEVARTRAAGAITLLVTPAATHVTRAALGPEPLLAVQQMVVVHDGDEAGIAAARTAARVPLGFLAGVPGYRASFLREGFTDADVDELSDRLVDALVAHGTEGEVAARIAAHRAAGADHVGLSILPAEGGPGLVEAARRLAPRVTREPSRAH